MLRIAVCDACRADVELLEQAMDGVSSYDVDYDVYFSTIELLDHIREQKDSYHIYIFEIEMPEMSGLELAEIIRGLDSKALFIFLTANAIHVMEVFGVVTFDYIQKPISLEKLESVLKKAVIYLQLIRQDFVFQYRKNFFRVNCGEILYIEKKGRQAVICTAHEIYKTNMNMKELWEQLDRQSFVQIHLSYIVNLRHIRAVEKNEVLLDTGVRVAVARSRKQQLKENYLEYIKRMIL
ncbi:MAG: LytTR family DNA-binding domain-containing protein [Eubacterium sp.]|nr:LytTR family DNA-binding domain-containing protein [Eubacterium sp.]